MTTYAKLEVNPDGHILQSSYTVPDDGVLPIAQASSTKITSLKTYTQTLFPTYATVALEGDEATMRITAIYFPPRIQGKRMFHLLGPVGVVALVACGIVGLLVSQSVYEAWTLAIIGLFVFGVSFLLALYPAWLWFKWLYFQGAPTFRTQKKVQENYPGIPLYHDQQTFLLDTAT